MRKIVGVLISMMLLGIVATQIQYVNAKSKKPDNDDQDDKFITSPLTSPCKPGWGFGDKNHCHTGPPGLEFDN